jgi:glycosyltransferase involved in cell wall biosynthesis
MASGGCDRAGKLPHPLCRLAADLMMPAAADIARPGGTATKIAIYLPDLSGGGAERLHVQLVSVFRDHGLAPRFLLDRRAGVLLDVVPPGCPVDSLDASRQISALPRLIRYLRTHRPDVLIANMEHMNVMAVLARRLARVPTRIIVTQHNAFSEQVKRPSWKWRMLPALYRAIVPRADAIVAVSAGVADDLAQQAGLDRNNIRVIHNGVVNDDFDVRAGEEPDHPWFAEGAPVIVGMGRMVAQKDFATLIRAFAMIAPAGKARLILLGDGPQREELTALIGTLGIDDRVSLPGFVANPLPWLRRASLFVLSSRFEGFGNVLAEALACGTPVVSTDCPYGPSEILDGGRFGGLVPVGDVEAMAGGIAAALGERPDRKRLRERGLSFSIRRCASDYEDVVRGLVSTS